MSPAVHKQNVLIVKLVAHILQKGSMRILMK